MCGITGIQLFKAESSDLLEKINDSVSCLQQRGPDAQAVYKTDRVALGHARLAIIDLNERAAQPMHDESGRYKLVFNGEIFNFEEIREELKKQGFSFFSSSDTEVLLKGYMHWGKEILSKLNGFFAFCLYDSLEKTLFLARDRFGIKPLVYSKTANYFAFASEIKSLLSFGVEHSIDHEALIDYFRFSYIPAPRSIYKGVKKLLPGHSIHLSADGTMQMERWYRLQANPTYAGISYQDAMHELQNLVEASVQRRLISDVPLGTFLSGGVDSSVITAAARKFNPSIHSFSIGFTDNAKYDESAYAADTAKFLGTKHTTIPVSANDMVNSLPKVLGYMSEPFADSSALAVNILCEKVRQHVTVALSGDGGDEQFAGYNKHRAFWRYGNPNTTDQAVSMLKPFWDLGNTLMPGFRQGLFDKLKKYAAFKNASASQTYVGLASWSRERFVSAKSNETDIFVDVMNELMPQTGVNSNRFDMNDFLYTDMHWVLPNDMLTKVDLMSMANSLEVRVPLLDHSIAEFAFSLPSEYKIDKSRQKKLLVDAFRNQLPPELFTRPKKGFEVPLGTWFSGSLNTTLNTDYLSDAQINKTGLFVPGTVAKLRKLAKQGGTVQQTYPVWAMMVFMHWYHQHTL